MPLAGRRLLVLAPVTHYPNWPLKPLLRAQCAVLAAHYLICVVLSVLGDRVRKQCQRPEHKMRKLEEGIVIQRGDFSVWRSIELLINRAAIMRDDPAPQIAQRSFRHQRRAGQRRVITLLSQSRVFLWPSGAVINYTSRAEMGPGLKESIKKMHRSRGRVMANVGLKLYNPAANMLEARVAPTLNHHYFEILENSLRPCRTLTRKFLIFREWCMREFRSKIEFMLWQGIPVTLYFPAWVKFKSYQDKIEVLWRVR